MKYFNVEFPNIVMMTGAGPSHKPVSHVSTEFSSFRVKHHRNRYVKLLLSCCDSCHQISQLSLTQETRLNPEDKQVDRMIKVLRDLVMIQMSVSSS